MKIIILAAGEGTRLGGDVPKPLVELKNKKTILDFQLENISKYFPIKDIIVVIGYKQELFTRAYPDLKFALNEKFAETNTGKSLLMALEKINNEDIIWMNGDVYFDNRLIELLNDSDLSASIVDAKNCGIEEIKYNLRADGYINELSKNVKDANGESLGINLIKAKDLEVFKKELEKIDDNDYFEKALENLTTKNLLNLKPIDKKNLFCEEIDFPKDLEKVKKYINQI